MSRELTPEQSEAYKKLRTAWYAKKAEVGRDLTQKGFGKKHNISQSAITQYLTGRIPLNLVALNRFCKELDLDPMEIFPTLAAESIQTEDTIESQIAEALKNCPQKIKENILALALAYQSPD